MFYSRLTFYLATRPDAAHPERSVPRPHAGTAHAELSVPKSPAGTKQVPRCIYGCAVDQTASFSYVSQKGRFWVGWGVDGRYTAALAGLIGLLTDLGVSEYTLSAYCSLSTE